MTKQEFLDKIDNIRQIVTTPANKMVDDKDDEVLRMLNSLKDELPILLEDEFNEGYELGLNRGWNHEDMDCE